MKLVEVVLAGASPADWFELREWLEARGFRVTESNDDALARLWAEREGEARGRGRPGPFRPRGAE